MDIRRIFLVPLLAAALVVFFATVDSVGAQQESALDLTVKISRIESLLDRIDAMAAETQPEGGQSPSMMLRGMIQGTDWIDPQRPVVIGIEMVNGKFAAAALVPFSRPNENFARSFNAMSAPDHYIVPLPPGKPLSLSDAALASLVSTSGVRPESSVSVEIAAKRLLQKAEPTLRKRIAEIEIPPQTTSAAPKIAAEDVRTLLEGMIDLGRQVQSFSFGGDIFAEQFRFISETRAVAGSQMARLFSSGAAVARVGELASDHQVRFKTRAYDIAGAVEMFADIIGPFYRKIGIDFAGLTEIASHFTGESAGGASYGADGVQFEMITVLTEQAAETDFLGKVYLPWVESYSRQMAATLSSLLGSEVPEIYRRTPDSTVAGVRVVGGRHTQPLFAADPAAGIPETTMTTEVRIAQIGELLLFAPDDRRMASLIQEARAMAPAPEQGPHMRVQIDMAAYFNGLMAMLPPSERPQIELPDTSSMESTLTFSGTRAIARATMKGAGIADMAAAAQAAKAAGPVMAAQAGQMDSGAKAIKRAPAAVASAPLPPEKDPDHWYAKGALAATYGADKWAIKYFEKVVSLDPERSDAWFEMGISYGELRWFDKAVEAVNKAIALQPDSGLYYYGRGRIYLMLGAEDRAMADFQRAADLGNPDARDHLRRRREATSS